MAREKTLVPSLINAKGMLGIIPFAREVGGPKFPPLVVKGRKKNLPPFLVIKREKNSACLLRVSSRKTGRKKSEGEERKKKERREEKRRNKATNLGLFVSKVYPSVCMVFLVFLMVEWLDFGRCYIQIF